jgi:hypothetical protein
MTVITKVLPGRISFPIMGKTAARAAEQPKPAVSTKNFNFVGAP